MRSELLIGGGPWRCPMALKMSGGILSAARLPMNALLRLVLMLVFVAPAVAQEAGRGLEAYGARDYARALKIWRPLANKGAAHAQYGLGAMYENGQGVAPNTVKASGWYRKAAEQGHPDAQFNLGNLYGDGRGVARDLDRGMQWLRKAAEQNLASAQFNLAMKYQHEPTVRDYAQAVAWYRKAAEQKHLNALVNLGALTMSGLGVAKDDASAVDMYLIAAKQGHALAQTYLGDMYSWGRGIERDTQKAVFWYRQAAELGEFQALLNLAKAYRDGVGVFADPVLAYLFATHDPKARKIDLAERSKLAEELRLRLTDEQRAEADELINAWISSKIAPVRSKTGRP
jgi:uncharacterized protein